MNRSNAARLLNIPENTTSEDVINDAYRKLAKKHHPDKGGTVKNFQLLGEAKETMLKPIQPKVDLVDLLTKMQNNLQEQLRREQVNRIYRMAQMNADMLFAIIMSPLVLCFIWIGLDYFAYLFPVLLIAFVFNVRIRKWLMLYLLKRYVKKNTK
jgi:hypothetical protein